MQAKIKGGRKARGIIEKMTVLRVKKLQKGGDQAALKELSSNLPRYKTKNHNLQTGYFLITNKKQVDFSDPN